jgi:hypothetical protein
MAAQPHSTFFPRLFLAWGRRGHFPATKIIVSYPRFLVGNAITRSAVGINKHTNKRKKQTNR